MSCRETRPRLRKEIESLKSVTQTQRSRSRSWVRSGSTGRNREELAKRLVCDQLETAALQQKYQFVRENTNRIREEIHRQEEERTGTVIPRNQHGSDHPGKAGRKSKDWKNRSDYDFRQIEDGQKRLDEKVLEKDEISGAAERGCSRSRKNCPGG